MSTISRSEVRTGRMQRRTGNPIRYFMRKEAVAGYLFVAPWILGFVLFYAYPLLNTVYYSFTDYQLFGDPQWVGLQNYTKLLLHDPLFGQTGLHMLLYVTLSTIISIGGGLGLALLLNRAFPGNHFFRVVFYLPSLMVGVAVSTMFTQVFAQEDYGLINYVLGFFHIPPVNWMANYNHPIVELFAVIGVNIWFMGGAMLIFLAGLKGISMTYYEAARIDGAGPWQGFRFVTLPLLTPVILFNTIMTLIGHIQVFDTPLVFATGGTGSVGASGFPSVLGYHNTLSMFLTYLYQEGFIYHDYGYGSAMAIVIFLITLILTAIVLLLFQRFTYYDRA